MSDVQEKFLPVAFGDNNPIYLGVLNLKQSLQYLMAVPDVEFPTDLLTSMGNLYRVICSIKFSNGEEGDDQ